MGPIYYLRTHDGLNVIRIAGDGISLQENDLSHSDWRLPPSSIPPEAQEQVHRFCAARDLPLPDWSVMAARRF
ncbi:MAG: hypothetical protein JO250_04755 [Armatimonadetes bacterium]|nr:hypothetical protein [Armatimonadota bacterium]